MAKLPILTAPNPHLKVVSDPVAVVDDAVRRLMDDMIDTMYAAPGIGLAAVQVGWPDQSILVEICWGGGRTKSLLLFKPENVYRVVDVLVLEEGGLVLSASRL